MEDQQDVVGKDGNSRSERVVESMGSENKSFDRGEIMVEVFGSDVFVDGVSGDKIEESDIHNASSEGDGNKVGPSESKDVVGRVEVEGVSLGKSVDVVNTLPPSGVDVVTHEAWNPGIEAIGAPNSEVVGASSMVIVEEKVTEAEVVTKDGATDRPVEAVLDEKSEVEEKKEVLPSSDSTDQFSSAETVTNSEDLGPSRMVIDEEKITEGEAVTAGGATPEPVDHPAEAVLDEKTEVEEKKEVLPSGDNTVSHEQISSAANPEDIGASPMVIDEEKITEADAVTKDSATPEALDCPTKAVLDEKTEIEEKKEVLPSSDKSATVMNSEIPVPSPVVISEETKTEDEAVTKESTGLVTPEPLNHPEEADLVENIEEKKEVLPSTDDSAKCVAADEVAGPSAMVINEEKSTENEAVDKDNADLVTPEPTSHPAETVSEIVDKEKNKVSLPSDDTANRDHVDADSVMSHEENMSHSAAAVSEVADIEEKKEVLPSSDDTANRDHVDPDSVMAHEGTTSHSAEAVSEIADIEEKKEVAPPSDDTANCDHIDADSMVSHKENMSHPAEAVPEIADVEEKKEVLPPSDDTANRDHVDPDSVMSHEETTSHSAEAVSEITDIEEKKEVSSPSDDTANCDHVDADSMVSHKENTSHPAEAVPEIADIEEKKEVLPPSDNSANLDHVDPDSVMSHSAKAVPEVADIEDKKEVLPPSDNSANRDHADADSMMSHEDTTRHSAEAVSEIAGIEGKKEVLPPSDNSANRDHVDVNSAITREETMSHPAEAVSEIVDIEETKEVLPSSDNSANPVHVDADSVMSHEDTTSHPAEAVSEVAEIKEKKEVSPPSDHVDADTTMSRGENMSHSAEAVSEIADIEEKIKVLPSSDNTANCDHVDADLVMSHEETMSHPAEAADIEEKKELLPSSDNSANRDHVDADLVMSHEETKAGVEPPEISLNLNGEGVENDAIDSVVEEDHLVDASDSAKAELASTDADVSIEKPVDDKKVLAAESKTTFLESDAQVSSVQDDTKLEPDDRVNDKGEATGNDECLGTDAEMETYKAHENHVFSDEPIQLTDSGVPDVLDSDKSLNVEIQADKIEKETNTMSSSAPSDKEIVGEVVDGDGSCEKLEEINTEIPAVDDSAEKMELVEEDVCSKVETEDLMAVESGTKQEVSEKVTETSNHEAGNIDSINSMAIKVAPVSSERTEKAESIEEITSLKKCNGFGTIENHTSETKATDVEEEQESEKSKLKHMSSFRMSQSGYLTPPENEGNFAQSDLVWGKVRSHPWWPGQIFDPDDASEKAVKYHKKDSYLVAYFGDQTFAWNDSSALKPFRPHFTQIEKQSSSEAFHNAVTCALEEVARRVELGLACSCIPKDAYAKIETQIVENTGIREEASHRFGVDESTQASHFEPNKLLDYITGLAARASSRPDRLDLVIAQAQLSAFCRFKGYRVLTEYPSSGELLESDEKVSEEAAASHKRRHVPKDGSQSKKERNTVELVGDREYSPDAEDDFGADDFGKSKKRKALDPLAEGSEKTVYAAKVSTSATQIPKPSFKIGECIRRVASQLTGSTPKDETVIDGSPNEQSEKQSAESLSVSELLSLIELMAKSPKKKHGFHSSIRAFFMGFRSSVAINRRGKKKKSEQTVGGSGEEFEFDDVNDSYWTDRIVQNYPDEQLPHEGQNGAANLQVVAFSGEKQAKTGRKSNSRKRFSSGSSPTAPTAEDEKAKRRKQESSPAELILNFAERNRVPSEINLNKMFRRFGPLMESETEVDHESGCAKVIFKRGSDAEVARNSAEKFNIFGPSALVNYQIGYTPVISVKILPVAMPQLQEDEPLMV